MDDARRAQRDADDADESAVAVVGTTEPEADTDGPALDTAAVEDGPGTIADPAPAGRHGRRERPARGDPLALPPPRRRRAAPQQA